MMKISALIVDDMTLARNRIKRLLAADDEIAIVGECAHGCEAAAAIEALAPELLFLDIQMPEIDGFELLAAIPAARRPVVIFITAYDQFALRAFEAQACDYLLKPLNPARLQTALTRAKDQVRWRRQGKLDDRLNTLLQELTARPKYLKRIAVKASGGTRLINVAELDWIETSGNYLCLHANRESYLLRETMNQLELKLAPAQFVRIHRSTIVNIERIKELQPLFNGDQTVILRDGQQLTLSRTYRERLLTLLDIS